MINNEVYTVYDFFVFINKKYYDVCGNRYVNEINGLCNIFNEFFLNTNYNYSYLVTKSDFIFDLKKLGFSTKAYNDILNILEFICFDTREFDDILHDIKEIAACIKDKSYSKIPGIYLGFDKSYYALDEVIDKIEFFEIATSYAEKKYKN